MKPNSEKEIAVFSAALRLQGVERSELLAGSCGSDEGFRSRIEELLQAAEKSEGFLGDEGLDATVQGARDGEKREREQIGRYKLLQQIGEGGCGVVYMAEQFEPVRRRVALKVIKPGMDTRQVIARFSAERQALAMMDHPNIAKVLDAGATDSGRPYFVMELVRGIKITEYCDKNNLATENRIELFLQVCRAIHHAHQKGIIHRDIKPSNILVTLDDGNPVPKVIDFGIAKATQGRLTDATYFTAFEQFLGTPAYMSPEQAEMSQMEIDPRSDIYSLGVLFYELVTGKPPFEQKDLLKAGIDQMRRMVREQEPPLPSTRLSSMENEELTSIASLRHSSGPKLISAVKGDLDIIIMKCLEKSPSRRYDNVQELAADVRRYSRDEGILARPPSVVYQLQKFIRRNKTAVIAGSAVLIGLGMGLALAAWLSSGANNLPARYKSDPALEGMK